MPDAPSMASFAYYDLREALAQTGCAVCRLLERDGEKFLDALLYEYSADAQTHKAFRAARGLCNHHGWDLTHHVGSALQIAVLYRASLDETLKQFDRGVSPADLLARLVKRFRGEAEAAALQFAEALEPTRPCLACEYHNKAQQAYLHTLAEHLNDSALEKAYQDSDGLCLPHTQMLLRLINDANILQKVITQQRRSWQKVFDQLTLFMDHYRAENADQMMGDEGDSWKRAVAILAGSEGLP